MKQTIRFSRMNENSTVGNMVHVGRADLRLLVAGDVVYRAYFRREWPSNKKAT